MLNKKWQYYFACNFLYWALCDFDLLLEDIETGELPERHESSAEPFDAVAEWALNEIDQFAVVYPIANSYRLIEQDWLENIQAISRKIGSNEPGKEPYSFYYLTCGWVWCILNEFHNLVGELNLPDVNQRYQVARPIFETLAKWLQDELADTIEKYLGREFYETVKEQIEAFHIQLTTEWLQTIQAATDQCVAMQK